MRLFVAIEVPTELRGRLTAAVAPLREALPDGVAWVPEASLHITLRFLGEQPEAVAARLCESLSEALANVARPPLRLDRAGTFPDARRARVLWLGGPTNSALTALYQRVEGACRRLGLEAEPRPFRLHVTVGRVRPRARLDPVAVVRAVDAVSVDLTYVAFDVVVMESVLSPAGARYRVVAGIPIGPRG